MGGFDPREPIDPAIGDELNERSRLKAGNPGFQTEPWQFAGGVPAHGSRFPLCPSSADRPTVVLHWIGRRNGIRLLPPWN